MAQTQTKMVEGVVTELPPNNLPARAEARQTGVETQTHAIHYPPKIAKALIAIADEIGAVEKKGFNEFQKYNYQKWEDVLDTISPLLSKHNIFIQQSQVASTLFENDALMAISYQFTIVHESGDAWPDRPIWTAVSRLRDGKGVYDDKCANKCHTQAHKYFILHTFNIKTRETVEDDADADGNGKGNGQRVQAPNPAAKPGDPREVTIPKGTAKDWVDAFLPAVTAAESVAAVQAFERLNQFWLDKVEKVAPDLYADMRREIDRHKAALIEAEARKTERAKDEAPTQAERGPAPPPRTGAPPPPPRRSKPTEATEATEAAGQAEPEGDGIPAELRRNKHPNVGKLLTEIGKLNNEADLERFLNDDDVYKLRKELNRQESTEVDIAYFRRAKTVRDAAR